MKKISVWLLGGALLVSSCGTYTGEGAYAGATFGSVLGSAIGGISGGWRGSDIGTIVGMAGGAAVGAAIGAAADQSKAERTGGYADRNGGYTNRNGGYAERSGGYAGNSGGYADRNGSYADDRNGGYADDRIDFDGAGPRDGHGDYSAARPRTYDPRNERLEPGYSVNYNSQIEIRNARIIDADRDGVLRGGEELKVTFEIMNHSSAVLYDVQPTVIDVTANKHLHISPNLHVESIAPHSGVRYTASILADRRLKDGHAVIRVAVAQGRRSITSQVKEFTVPTRRALRR